MLYRRECAIDQKKTISHSEHETEKEYAKIECRVGTKCVNGRRRIMRYFICGKLSRRKTFRSMKRVGEGKAEFVHDTDIEVRIV